MEDLLGSFDATSAKPSGSRSTQASHDLLSFDVKTHTTPAKIEGRETHDIANFVTSSPVTQWKEASTPRGSPYVNNGKQGIDMQDDDFGDFQGVPQVQVSSKHKSNEVMTVSFTSIKQSSHGGEIGDEDEFGDFVESPLPVQDNFPAIPVKPRIVDVPNPTELLKFLLDHVLQVPTAFIRELAMLSYSLKKVVLNHPRTKRWILAVLESSRIAQRIIHGRQRRVKRKTEWRELQIVTDRVLQHWKDTLMPRLSSLGGTTLRIIPLKSNAFNDNYDANSVCQICYTEEDESGMLERAGDGRIQHKSCAALLRAMQSEQ